MKIRHQQISRRRGFQVTDWGVTWAKRTAPTSNCWSMAVSSDGTKLVAVGTDYFSDTSLEGWIYTSSDSGATWTRTDAPTGFWSVASSADGTRLVAVDHLGPIYTSADS